MTRMKISLLVVLLLSFSGVLAGQEKTNETNYSYRDNEGGFKQLINELIKTRKEQNVSEFQNLCTSLVIPKPDEWFESTFGPDIGNALASEYPHDGIKFQSVLGRVFDEAINSNLTKVRVEKIIDECGQEVDSFQYPVLSLRIARAPIYQAILSGRNGSAARRLWAFAYIDGSFRYLQSLQIKASLKYPHVFSISQEALGTNLIHAVEPAYPIEARNRGLQGTVKLSVTVDASGFVKNIWVLEGTCLFSKPAVDAVKNWQYTPHLVDGVAREVSGRVDVVFRFKH